MSSAGKLLTICSRRQNIQKPENIGNCEYLMLIENSMLFTILVKSPGARQDTLLLNNVVVVICFALFFWFFGFFLLGTDPKNIDYWFCGNFPAEHMEAFPLWVYGTFQMRYK